MKKIQFGLIAGLIFGILDVLIMIPIPLPDKTLAMAGAFVNRFAIGLFIPIVNLKLPYWLQGLIIGGLLSLPDAIITKTYAPILGIGLIGGLAIGILSQKLLKN